MSERYSWPEDDGDDGVQYDTFYAPSAQQLEAEEIRRAAWAEEQAASERASRRGLDQYGTRRTRY